MKKTIAFVLALVMLLSLTACSGNTTQSPAEGTQPSSAPVEKTETGESGKDGKYPVKADFEAENLSEAVDIILNYYN